MQLIDGKELAKTIREDVSRRVAKMDRVPCLCVLLVGDDPASHLYVSLKQKHAEEVGVRLELIKKPASVSTEELIAQVEDWNARKGVDAILVQLPLPNQHDENRVIAAIDPKKDVDGFHPVNREALLQGEPIIVSPVHEGVLRLIASTPIE
mgnify:FL=1